MSRSQYVTSEVIQTGNPTERPNKWKRRGTTLHVLVRGKISKLKCSSLLLMENTFFLSQTCVMLYFFHCNWGLLGYTYFFLFLLKNIDCGYSLEPPRPPTIYVLRRNKKNIRILSENFRFLVVKISIYLNRRVFVMIMSLRICISSMSAWRNAVSLDIQKCAHCECAD